MVKKILIFIIAALVAVFLVSGYLWYYHYSYQNRVYPGVKIGGYDVGGLSRREVINFIENINNRYAKEGIDFIISDAKNQRVKFNTVGGGESAVEIIKLNSEAAADAALTLGRRSYGLSRIYEPILLRTRGASAQPVLVYDEAILDREVAATLSSFEDRVRDASLVNITAEGSAKIVAEKGGLAFDYPAIITALRENILKLSFQPVIIKRTAFSPIVTYDMVAEILPNLPAILRFGPLGVADESVSSGRRWVITERELPKLIGVRATEDGRAVFTLEKEATANYLKNVIAPEVEMPARNAKFSVENNRVVEFENSSAGREIDIDGTYENLSGLFEVRNSLILHNTSTDFALLKIREVLPEIQISSSNDLGIREFLGSGTSTFKDSHTRRIQNIAHAVERLNGTLIKPGEEFSAVKYAGPFTAENGYLPEQIIKGRTIKEEIGGGMCQIGTTLFRMAMQTGLPITERHNHSLVVSYYADPVNGNPGTDATLYEPILDLKFLNDTGNHMLLLTEIDYKKQLLTFSLWGASDGRSGWYTHPKVSKWISPPAETEYIISDKDADGNPVKTEKCQASFRGAMASFTYSRVTPEGEQIDRVFDSYYRPLPKICVVPPSSTAGIATSTLSN